MFMATIIYPSNFHLLRLFNSCDVTISRSPTSRQYNYSSLYLYFLHHLLQTPKHFKIQRNIKRIASVLQPHQGALSPRAFTTNPSCETKHTTALSRANLSTSINLRNIPMSHQPDNRNPSQHNSLSHLCVRQQLYAKLITPPPFPRKACEGARNSRIPSCSKHNNNLQNGRPGSFSTINPPRHHAPLFLPL